MRQIAFVLALAAGGSVWAATGPDDAFQQPVTVERGWYTPHQLMPVLAATTPSRWAMPETLAGTALVDGPNALAPSKILDDACRQWGLAWARAGGNVIVVHRPVDGLETLAAWELGWSRDGRAVPLLAAMLAGDDTAAALAAAKAIEVLEKRVPLGRTDRVEPPLPGRTTLAAAFPPDVDLMPLLDSPCPPVRAAALRLLLGVGGDKAQAAKVATADDEADLVRQVRQQMLFPVPAERAAKAAETLPPLPDDVKAAADRMLADIGPLARNSEWAMMRRRARILAEWARGGSGPAVEALLELSRTKHQASWYPGYVHMQMSQVGDGRILARLKELFARGRTRRDTLVRGLEDIRWGEGLLAFTAEHLGNQTVLYVTANKAGAEAVEALAAWAALQPPACFAAIDALGAIGGPKATAALVPLLVHENSTVVFRSAKALGQVGTSGARAALLKASRSDDRYRRHAAALFLGRIGGPDAAARLRELAEDKDRLVAAAAADGLEQIGTQAARAAAEAFHERDAGLPPLVYRPRNPRFGADFPVNKWVDLGIRIEAYAKYGEMGWNYEAANRLFVRYGGCSGYTNELTVFDLGTGRFVQRRPNEEMAGWGSRRPQRGCSGGRVCDPYRKVVWIGRSIGGSAIDLAISEYYVRGGDFGFASYDLATDRFRGAPYLENYYGGPPNRFAYDWKHGLLYPVKFSPFKNEKFFWAVNTRDRDPYTRAAWMDKTTKGDYPRMLGYTVAAVDQHSGLLVVYLPVGKRRDDTRDEPETWTFNPVTGRWRNMKPDRQPRAYHGAGFDYDPFHKVLILQGGKKVAQYGGPEDSLTWTYDVRTNTWTDTGAVNGPGNPWVGSTAFDPEHNVLVMFHFRNGHVWAYRHKPVEPGTRVEW
jgi:hypothetical protein